MVAKSNRGVRVPIVLIQVVGCSGSKCRTRCWQLDGCRPQSSANTRMGVLDVTWQILHPPTSNVALPSRTTSGAIQQFEAEGLDSLWRQFTVPRDACLQFRRTNVNHYLSSLLVRLIEPATFRLRVSNGFAANSRRMTLNLNPRGRNVGSGSFVFMICKGTACALLKEGLLDKNHDA